MIVKVKRGKQPPKPNTQEVALKFLAYCFSVGITTFAFLLVLITIGKLVE